MLVPCCLEPVNVTLFGERDFACVIKDSVMQRLSCLTWVGLMEWQGSFSDRQEGNVITDTGIGVMWP